MNTQISSHDLDRPFGSPCCGAGLRGAFLRVALAICLWPGICAGQPDDDEGAAPQPTQVSTAQPAKLSKEEIAELEAKYNAASATRRAELKAYYADLGMDLESALGFTLLCRCSRCLCCIINSLFYCCRLPQFKSRFTWMLRNWKGKQTRFFNGGKYGISKRRV
jgi:hypothetical protein